MNVRMQHDSQAAEGVASSLRKMSRDGQSWLSAEAKLARAEVAADGKRLAIMLALAASAFGCVFSAVILLSAFVVSLLAPYVNGLANAAGLIGATLMVLAGVMFWRMRAMATRRFGLAEMVRRWWSMILKVLEAV